VKLIPDLNKRPGVNYGAFDQHWLYDAKGVKPVPFIKIP
jgi:hypothetical protein